MPDFFVYYTHMARGEGGPDSERERDEYIAWFGLSESEIVKGELISRFAENIIIGGGAIDDEFQFWMNRLELGGVSRRVTNDYLDRAKRRFEWVKKKLSHRWHQPHRQPR